MKPHLKKSHCLLMTFDFGAVNQRNNDSKNGIETNNGIIDPVRYGRFLQIEKAMNKNIGSFMN